MHNGSRKYRGVFRGKRALGNVSADTSLHLQGVTWTRSLPEPSLHHPHNGALRTLILKMWAKHRQHQLLPSGKGASSGLTRTSVSNKGCFNSLTVGYSHDTFLLWGVTQNCGTLEDNYTWHEKPLVGFIPLCDRMWEKGILSVARGSRAKQQQQRPGRVCSG